MVKLFCAVVGAAGSAFSVRVDEGDSVDDLKKAITKEQEYDFAASELRLYLAKKGATWLTENEVKGGRDTSGLTHLDAARAGISVVGLSEDDVRQVDKHHVAAGNDPVNALVVVPAWATSVMDVSAGIEKFNTLIEFATAKYEGGVPSAFRTYRSATVDAFFKRLFLVDKEYLPLVFDCAPPLSGKSAMCDLLYNHIVRSKPEALVARIRANRMAENGKFAEFFKLLYGCDLEAFCAYNCDRVVLIDEAQITYNDEQLWMGYVKDALESQIPGLRFVIFSSYGSFDVYRRQDHTGPPILVPAENTFGLNATQSKPGLQLSREELDEMVRDSISAIVCDFI